MIDLHCHSHFSDGVLSPEALLNKAIKEKIQILALTDHDTTAGLPMLHNMAKNLPITIINGIELSTRWKKYDIHILGLNIGLEHKEMEILIAQQNNSRIIRALQIADQLKRCGVEDAYAKACKIAGHERVGRPHFAQVLVDEGLVFERQMAFKKYLGAGRAAYVPTSWISINEAVKEIIASGGQAVLAHPLKYPLTRTKLHELLRDFKEVSGVGLEVVSGEMTTTQIQESAGLCLRFQLMASTGSDYHGDGLSRIALGKQSQLPVNCIPIWQQWNS